MFVGMRREAQKKKEHGTSNKYRVTRTLFIFHRVFRGFVLAAFVRMAGEHGFHSVELTGHLQHHNTVPCGELPHM